MKKAAYVFIVLLLAALFVGAASANTIGGDRGIIKVECNVEGASVSLISISNAVYATQTIQNGYTEFAVYTTGTPVDKIYVSADGYASDVKKVVNPPAGKTEIVKVELQPIPTGPIGGDKSFLDFTSNIIGAKVVLKDVSGNEAYTGYTDSNGFVEFAVLTTGTPLVKAELTATGWDYQSLDIQTPAAGKTVLYAFPAQQAAPTTTVPPAPTQSPMGFAVLGLLGALGAIALVKRD